MEEGIEEDEYTVGKRFLCLYIPERVGGISPRSEMKIFNFTIEQLDTYPILREILTPLTIPKQSIFYILKWDDKYLLDNYFGFAECLIPVGCIFGENIIQKFVDKTIARIVFENYLTEITTTIPFSGDLVIDQFSNTINGLPPQQFLEIIRVKFFEE